jgi:hypothetical protein
VFPGAVIEPSGIVDHYRRMSHQVALLGRLQNPAKAGLLSKTL